MTSLRASATDHGLARANTAISGAGVIPVCQHALLLKHQKAPGELDHAAADPGIAGSQPRPDLTRETFGEVPFGVGRGRAKLATALEVEPTELLRVPPGMPERLRCR
jgi:hypothetical protein